MQKKLSIVVSEKSFLSLQNTFTITLEKILGKVTRLPKSLKKYFSCISSESPNVDPVYEI